MSITEAFLTQHYQVNFDKLSKRYARRFDNQHIGEDVVQEAYARAWKYRNTYNPEQPFENWFGIICFNAFKRLYAEEQGHVAEDLDEFAVAGIQNSHEIDRLWSQILGMIKKERKGWQEVLYLHFDRNYSIKEISEFHEMSHRNIRVAVYAFRNKIRKLLE